MPDPQKVFKAECRKHIARQKKGVLCFLLLLAVLLFACATVIGVSYLFRIRSVEITGNVHCSADEIRTSADIRIGAPLSSVDEKGLEEKLTKDYVWISEVQVKRNLFGKVRIRVTEYTPAHTVRADNGLFLVSENFTVLERVEETETPNGAIVLLPDGRNPKIGEVCELRGDEPLAVPRIKEAIDGAEGLPAVTEIDVRTGYYYKLNLENGLTVVLGNTDALPVKLELAAAVFAQNREKTWSHAEINVSDIKKSTFRVTD